MGLAEMKEKWDKFAAESKERREKRAEEHFKKELEKTKKEIELLKLKKQIADLKKDMPTSGWQKALATFAGSEDPKERKRKDDIFNELMG